VFTEGNRDLAFMLEGSIKIELFV